MNNLGDSYKEYRATLNFSAEEEEEIRLEKELLVAMAKAREEKGLTQKQLAAMCGLSQPVVARLERSVHSPQVSTLLRVLRPIGYTLAIVPVDGDKQ